MPIGLSRALEQPRWRLLFAGGLVLFVLSYLSYWAGAPQKGLTAFLIGMVALAGGIAFYGWLAWRFFLRPLPAGAASQARWDVRVEVRRLLAILLALGAISLTVGGFWDEVWHRKYGLPFGEDLLWPPHLLIYFGLLLPPVLAGVSLVLHMARGRGSIQQRVRSDRHLGLLVVLGGFLLFTVPADPVWHIIYGEDISAWSLPHLVLMLSALILAILGASFQVSTAARGPGWTSVIRLSPASAFSLAFFTAAASIMAQVLIGDFAFGNTAALARPAWLLPSLICGVTVLVGSLANHATRSYGAATVVGLLTLATRAALVAAFDFQEIGAASWLPLLPPLVALDIAYGLRASRGQAPAAPPVIGAVVAIGALPTIFLLPLFFVSPDLSLGALLTALLMTGLSAWAANWLGRMLGEWLTLGAEASLQPATGRLAWAGAALFVGAILVIIYLVGTSGPPTHVF